MSKLGEFCPTLNQMCWPVIITTSFKDPGIFCHGLSLIGWRSASPCAFWKTTEQKVECQFNWCVCGSSCTLQISSSVQVKDKGLDTLICAQSRDELPCVTLVAWNVECCCERKELLDFLHAGAPSVIPGCLFLHFNMTCTAYASSCIL